MTSKVALITGGSRGIGKALVQQFKNSGWTVATCATKISHLKTSAADFSFECDVSNLDQVKKGIQSVVQKFGKIDALVNNAGLAGNSPLEPDFPDDYWHRIIDVNLHGTFYMCKYAAPHLPNSTGRIINIASVLALQGVPDHAAYCAAKHGVLGFTRAFAQYLAPRKVTVNAVCPGWVRTDMAEGRMKEIGITESQIQTSVPLGRLIEPEEVADFVYYLASSSGGAMITGKALTIDGGTLP